MSKTEPWFQQAHAELNELLARRTQLKGGDAWRALVLDSRLASAPLNFQLARLPEEIRLGLASQVLLPDQRELLELLTDTLESGEEPAGAALDSVLDLDDLIGVLGISGRLEEARDLASRAAAVLSLFPEMSLPMGTFAERRLVVLAAWTPQRILWQSVEQASASIMQQQIGETTLDNEAPLQLILDSKRLGGELEPTTRRHISTSAGQFAGPSYRIFKLPIQPFRAAASTSAEESLQVLSLEGDQMGFCYWQSDTGGWEIDIRLDSKEKTPVSVELVAVDLLTTRVLASNQLTFQIDGRDLYVTLPGGVGLPLEMELALKREQRSRNQIELRLILHD